MDRREVSALFTLDGTTLTHTQQQPGKPDFIISWTFSSKFVAVSIKIKDISSFRLYQAVE